MTTMSVVGECFFWYWLSRVVPDEFHRAVKRLCVCVCVCVVRCCQLSVHLPDDIWLFLIFKLLSIQKFNTVTAVRVLRWNVHYQAKFCHGIFSVTDACITNYWIFLEMAVICPVALWTTHKEYLVVCISAKIVVYSWQYMSSSTGIMWVLLVNASWPFLGGFRGKWRKLTPERNDPKEMCWAWKHMFCINSQIASLDGLWYHCSRK